MERPIARQSVRVPTPDQYLGGDSEPNRAGDGRGPTRAPRNCVPGLARFGARRELIGSRCPSTRGGVGSTACGRWNPKVGERRIRVGTTGCSGTRLFRAAEIARCRTGGYRRQAQKSGSVSGGRSAVGATLLGSTSGTGNFPATVADSSVVVALSQVRPHFPANGARLAVRHATDVLGFMVGLCWERRWTGDWQSRPCQFGFVESPG